MSFSNLIKETLDILDLNLIFTENCLTLEKIGEQICKVVGSVHAIKINNKKILITNLLLAILKILIIVYIPLFFLDI